MKISFLLLLLFLSISYAGVSQDKIITTQSDTIDCKIIKITKKVIYFDMITKNIKSSGKLPLSNVSRYTIESKVSENHETVQKKSVPYQRLRLGLGGGFGYVFASSKEAEQELVDMGFSKKQAQSYYNRLRLGQLGSADLTYFISPNYGMGAKYKFFETSNSQEGFLDPQEGNNLIYGNLSEKIYVNFFGVTFHTQQCFANQPKLRLTSTYALGLATYRNETDAIVRRFLLTGKSFAADINIGIEYFVRKNISLGMDLSGFYSSIHKLKVNDGTNSTTMELDKDNYENISRIDLSFGIKIYR